MSSCPPPLGFLDPWPMHALRTGSTECHVLPAGPSDKSLHKTGNQGAIESGSQGVTEPGSGLCVAQSAFEDRPKARLPRGSHITKYFTHTKAEMSPGTHPLYKLSTPTPAHQLDIPFLSFTAPAKHPSLPLSPVFCPCLHKLNLNKSMYLQVGQNTQTWLVVVLHTYIPSQSGCCEVGVFESKGEAQGFKVKSDYNHCTLGD